jgi:hypothetical protein
LRIAKSKEGDDNSTTDINILWPSTNGLTPKTFPVSTPHSEPNLHNLQENELKILQDKVAELELKIEKDRDFYDTALETRTN